MLPASQPKVVVIGLDGATFDLLDPWIEEGRLPALRRIAEQGGRRVLTSTIPPHSFPAWASFYTGMNPGRHGIFSFYMREPDRYRWRPVDAGDRRAVALWEILTAHGLRGGFLNIPLTYPPEPLNGVMISGWLGTPSLSSSFTYPPELKDHLLRRFGSDSILEPDPYNQDPTIYLRDLLASIDTQTRIVLELNRQHRFDVTVAVFGQVDRVQHFFWKQMDAGYPGHDPKTSEALKTAIRQVYEAVDLAIDRILAQEPGATVFILSDHGTGPYERDLYLDAWLEREGYLVRRGRGGTPGLAGWSACSPHRAVTGTYYWLKRWLPSGLRGYVKARAQSGLLARIRSLAMSPMTFEVDWERTRAYSIDEGRIYLNLRGREPAGCVSPGAESARLLEEIRAGLMQLVDPQTGKPVVESVYLAEELYEGAAMSRAPDLILSCERLGYQIKPSPAGAGGELFGSTHRWPGITLEHSANHRVEGVFLAAGPSVRRGARLPSARIIDLAPTILYCLGLPIPSDMDGRVLLDLFEPSFTQAHPVEMGQEAGYRGSSGSREMDQEELEVVRRRLRGIGYLE